MSDPFKARLTAATTLPADGCAGTLVGRVWHDGGPHVVVVREDGVYDISTAFPTMSALIEATPREVYYASGAAVVTRIGDLSALLAASAGAPQDGEGAGSRVLSPVDLQAVKACGVTFAASMLERVIEERAAGDPAAAADIRATIAEEVGADLTAIVPGSEVAERLKEALQARGLWSQYLEVGIGPYAEVFTKAQPMSSVGTGAIIGIHPESHWNNPEPEVVLVLDSHGEIKGATLGNDVNLRDFEGRSALLLGKAKDNNASTALGPFIRLFDDTFSLDDVREMEVTLDIAGEDGFALNDTSSMRLISRDVADLAGQTINRSHQYPDGLVLFTGTMFAPVKDRDAPGSGFTHKPGDVVEIACDRLGRLVNRVDTTDRAAPWTFGVRALMASLASRELI